MGGILTHFLVVIEIDLRFAIGIYFIVAATSTYFIGGYCVKLDSGLSVRCGPMIARKRYKALWRLVFKSRVRIRNHYGAEELLCI